MIIQHTNGTMFRIVAEDSRDARMSRDKRLITSANGTPWHAGAIRNTPGGISEPVAWQAYPGHCTECGPASGQITAELTAEAIDWASDCLAGSHLLRDPDAKATEKQAIAYIERNYPDGIRGFARDMVATVSA